MEWLSIILAVVVGLLISIFWYNKRPKNFPPGPMALPLVGYYPFLGKRACETLTDLGKKFGSIYSLKMGTRDILVLNDWRSVKEALLNQNEIFAGRPVTYTFDEVRARTDIGSCDGAEWREKRNFTLQALRTFGFGKESMENLIAEEVAILVDQLKSKVGGKINVHKLFFAGFLNVIWVTAAGKKVELAGSDAEEFYDVIATLIHQASSTNPLQYAPIWKYLPKYRKQHLRYLETHKKLYAFIDKLIDEHIDTYKDGFLRDFIDFFLAESERRKEANNNDLGVFQRNHLRGILYNFNNGGVDTGNSTLEFALLYMATWPDIQKKVQEELDRVIGRDRRPAYGERKMLPYTQAVLLEVQRWASVLPLIFPHAPTKTTKLLGYTIPKGTFTLVNAWGVHNDPQYWGDPEVFRPERFLNEKGEAVTPEYFIPFSAGRRLCLGDNMARVEMFLFFTAVMQQFSFSLIPGEPAPSLVPDDGLVVHPPPFSLIINNRPDAY